MSLVVTGTIGIDTVETPDGQKRENLLGGSCAYFAAAASMHTETRLVAAVGGDWPDEHRAQLEHFSNINTAGLERRAESKTFAWGGKYQENMDHRDTLYTNLGVLEEAPPAVPESYTDSEYIFLANTHPAVQIEMLKHFPERKLAVADTMDLWINTARDDFIKMLDAVDGLVLNYDEAELFTGKRNPVVAARAILNHGPTFVVVKKGEHGCLFVYRDKRGDGIGALPAFPAEDVVDPTGAGDTFGGGMMGYLANESSDEHGLSLARLKAALAHGTVMASFTIESFSLDRLRELTPDELKARYDEYVSMVRVH